MYQQWQITVIVQAVETGVTSGERNFPAIEFGGKKSPDLAFSNVDRYACERAFQSHQNKIAGALPK